MEESVEAGKLCGGKGSGHGDRGRAGEKACKELSGELSKEEEESQLREGEGKEGDCLRS